MKTLLKATAIILAFITVGIIGCQKDIDEKNIKSSDLTIKSSSYTSLQNWYYNKFSQENNLVLKNDEVISLILWKMGSSVQVGKLKITEFPLLTQKNVIPITNNENLTNADKQRLVNSSFKRAIFTENADGKIQLDEYTFVPSFKYLKGNNFDLSKLSYGNKNSLGFSGSIYKKSWGATTDARHEIYVNGKLIKTGKKTAYIPDSNTSSVEEEQCTYVEYCTFERICTIYGDGMEECGPWVNTGECWYEEICDPNGGGGENEGPCGGSECDPGAISPQENEFNEYVQMNINQDNHTADVSQPSTNLIQGSYVWNVAEASIASWRIKALTTYSYLNNSYYDLNINAMVFKYNIQSFATGPGEYEGSNTFIQSTYTQPNPTVNEIHNNDMWNAYGKSRVVGSIRHQLGLPINCPYCPKTLDVTEGVDNYTTFTPR